jgi:hypothetical protein
VLVQLSAELSPFVLLMLRELFLDLLDEMVDLSNYLS